MVFEHPCWHRLIYSSYLYRTGGPFGIEPTVKAAGNFYAIICIALMPIFWSIPELYMTYKLSTLYPCASGVSFSVIEMNVFLCALSS